MIRSDKRLVLSDHSLLDAMSAVSTYTFQAHAALLFLFVVLSLDRI